jgi:flagellar biosynthesis/type III secretory pathway protein FliH
MIEKITRNELDSLLVYDISEYCKKYSVNADELENLFLYYFNKELKALYDKAYEEGKEEGHEEGYNQGLNEIKNEVWDNEEKYVSRKEYDELEQTLEEVINKNKEDIEEAQKKYYSLGYSHGVEWENPKYAKDLLQKYFD